MCTPFSLLFTQSKKLPLLRLVTLLLVFLSAFTRTLFFMIDPYATNNVIPPFLEATFFTITYPCLNTSMCLVLLTLYIRLFIGVFVTVKNPRANEKP